MDNQRCHSSEEHNSSTDNQRCHSGEEHNYSTDEQRHSKGGRQGQVFEAYDIAAVGIMAAVLVAAKYCLSAIPNVELVSFLLLMFTLFYGRKTIIAAVLFTTLETVIFGFQLWVIMYLYVWPVLILVIYYTRKYAGVWFYSTLLSLYGFAFGALCSIPYLFIGGPVMMFTWWVAGIPFDVIHGISNFVVCLVLYRPVYSALTRACTEIRIGRNEE